MAYRLNHAAELRMQMDRKTPDPEVSEPPAFNLLFNKHSQVPSVLAAASRENPFLRSRSRSNSRSNSRSRSNSASGTRGVRRQRSHSSPPHLGLDSHLYTERRTARTASNPNKHSSSSSSSKIHISDIDLIVRSMLDSQLSTMRTSVMGEVNELRREVATLRSTVTEKNDLLRLQDERFAQLLAEQNSIIAHGGSEMNKLKAYVDSNIHIERNKRLLLSKKLYKKLSSDIRVLAEASRDSHSEASASIVRTNEDVLAVRSLLRKLENQLLYSRDASLPASTSERPPPHSPCAAEESKAADCSAIGGGDSGGDLTKDSLQDSLKTTPYLADTGPRLDLQQWELERLHRKMREVAETSCEAVCRLGEGVADVQQVTLQLAAWAHRVHGHLRIPKSLVPLV